MNVLITGGTGLVGSALIEKLLIQGHHVSVVTRNKQRAKALLPECVHLIEHDLCEKPLDAEVGKNLKSVEAVINLVGENVSQGRWTQDKKNRILESRVLTTQNIINSFEKKQLKVFIGASAIGIYEQSNLWIDESSRLDKTFLADVCQKWEEAYDLVDQSTRKVVLRIGVVLSSFGGMLEKLLPIYRAGIGGKVGSGKQWLSWIHIDDLVDMIMTSLTDDNLRGIFNGVSQRPVTNEEFNKTFSMITQRPAWFPIPKLAVRLLYGEQADLIMSNYKAKTSFPMDFKFSTLEAALEDIYRFKVLPPSKVRSFHYTFKSVQFIDRPIEEVYQFFGDASNLEKITPPLLNFRILTQSTEQIQEGTEFTYRLKVHGVPIRWKTIITNWIQNVMFTDFQAKGPYKTWFHTHSFHKVQNGVLMIDEVNYALPFSYLGDMIGGMLVKKDITKIFSYRKQVIRQVYK